MQLKQKRGKIKIYVFILASLCTLLDGFVLLFLGYNSSILTKEWNWNEHSIALLDIIYHLVTALGGILSIVTTNISTKKGFNFSLILSMTAFLSTLFLLNVRLYYIYAIIFFFICLSNGHLQNINTTLIVKKYSPKIRGPVYVLAYFFTQFGKLIFACLIYQYNEEILKGRILITVIPILIILMAQIIFTFIVVNNLKKKKSLKENQNPNTKSGNIQVSLVNFIEINIPENEFGNNNFKNNFHFKKILYDPLIELATTYTSHSFNLIFLNISLGVQFFSMINVFPLLRKKTFVFLIDEILISKLFHTLFLLFLPILFFFEVLTRKILLNVTFLLNLLLNIFILFDIFNTGLMIHFFRFIWNVSFITINLYCAESIPKKLRNFNTAIMYFIFKLSCLSEIMTIEKLISYGIYVPVILNIIILFGDLLVVNKLKIETHLINVEEIEEQIMKRIEHN